MLITFRSKSSADVTMFGIHAKRILELLAKPEQRGVITSAEAPQAIALIENEIAATKQHPASEDVKRDVHAHHGDNGDDPDHEAPQAVSFAVRAFPLLEMLRAAKRNGNDTVWGV
jgi:hypothetical protein